MTITTPPQETRTRRPRRTADDAASGAVETRPAKSGTARSGAGKAGATKTRAAATTERRRRGTMASPPKGKAATKPAKPAKPAKPKTAKPAATTKTAKTTKTATKVGKTKVTVVRRSATPPRAPFVLLVVGLLGGALVSLLLLNTVLAQDAFTLSELQRGNQQLSERKEALQEDITRENSPQVLHNKARGLGMVDGQRPAFIDAPSGRVTEGGSRPPGVSDEAMAAAAAAGVTGAPGAIMPPAGAPRTGTPRTGGGTR